MTGPIARILLRVGSGYMIAGGWLPVDYSDLATDPDAVYIMEASVGSVIWTVTEVWYILANKFGWAK